MLLIAMWLLLSLAAGWLGRKRTIGFWGFFIASIVFTPVLVLLILVATQPASEKKNISVPPT